ncbi:MAG: polysaccharide biosynthesis C-terminal domain-containing protein [Deltaproteobacteria bacterium]|nr:polysaccharide biosynthesis C-terminal domain-containing protein [Deltaproteobacteria bacterium]
MVVPQLLLTVITGSITQVLVPLLTIENKGDFQKEAWNFFQGIGFIFFVLALLLFGTATLWTPWIVPGFDFETRLLTITLVRVQLIGMVFMALNGVAWSVYHSRQKFLWAEMSAVLGTLGGFFLLLWGLPRFGIIMAAWAMVLKSALQMVLLLPELGVPPFRKWATPDWKSETAGKAWRKLYPLLLGSTFYKTGDLVDRFLASMTSAGQLSLLYFASQIYMAGNLILSKALAAPMVPLLAKRASAREWILFRRIVNNRLLWILGITFAVFMCIVFSGGPLLTLLFGHGRFTIGEVLTLHWILIALVGVWIGGALGQILSSGFYAKGNTRTPTKIGIFGFTIGLGLKVVGFWYWGILGIAVGTSLYYVLNAFLLNFALQKNLNKRILVDTREG